MKHHALIISIILLLSACSFPVSEKSRLAEKIACQQYSESDYKDETTATYTKTYEFFYSTALDTCIADRYESLYQPGHKDYFMRLALIDTVSKHTLIDYNEPDDTNNFFYVSKEDYEKYANILKVGTKQELEKFKESMTKNAQKKLKNR